MPTGDSVLGKSIMAYHPWAIFPPPLTVPEDDVLVRTIGNRQLELKISGSPSCAQSAIDLKFAIGVPIVIRGRVAVTPKLPAVPVVAESVTEVTARINLPAPAAGIKPFNGSIKDAGLVAARDADNVPVVPSLYVTATVAVTAVEPVAVYHSSHH